MGGFQGKKNYLYKPQDKVIPHVQDMNPVGADLLLPSIHSLSHEESQAMMLILTGFIMDMENRQYWIP